VLRPIFSDLHLQARARPGGSPPTPAQKPPPADPSADRARASRALSRDGRGQAGVARPPLPRSRPHGAGGRLLVPRGLAGPRALGEPRGDRASHERGLLCSRARRISPHASSESSTCRWHSGCRPMTARVRRNRCQRPTQADPFPPAAMPPRQILGLCPPLRMAATAANPSRSRTRAKREASPSSSSPIQGLSKRLEPAPTIRLLRHLPGLFSGHEDTRLHNASPRRVAGWGGGCTTTICPSSAPC
jgi:hypothetical protein